MTIPEPLPGPDDDDQEHDGDVLAVRDDVDIRERLTARTCLWCGAEIEYAGVGRPPLYCRDSHRKRASELRTAQRRAGRPVDEGGRTTEPVREVIERTETRTRTTVRRGPSKVRLPQDIHEWTGALWQLRSAVREGRFTGFHDLLVRELEDTIRAVHERQEQTAPRVAPVPPQRPARPQGSKKKKRRRR